MLFLLFVGFLAATTLQAWTGPTATAPNGNVPAPINVGTTDQVKNAGLSLNSLLVSGNAAIYNSDIAEKLGINTATPVVALDVNGTIKIANGGELCQSVSAGAIRYNNTSNSLEYCNGTSWGALGGGTAAGGPSAIRTFISSGTWTRPAGVTKVVVYVTGGGGGGGGGNYPGSVGATGGTSSFGTYASATGGVGGDLSGGGGSGGSGSGGDLNLTGQTGEGATTVYSNQDGYTDIPGIGGVSFWGGAYGTGGHGSSSGYYYDGGGGGGGGTAIKVLDVSSISSVPVTVGTGSGGGATSGAVVVYEYSGSSGAESAGGYTVVSSGTTSIPGSSYANVATGLPKGPYYQMFIAPTYSTAGCGYAYPVFGTDGNSLISATIWNNASCGGTFQWKIVSIN